MFQQLQEMDMEFDRSCEVLPPDGWIEVGDFSVAGTISSSTALDRRKGGAAHSARRRISSVEAYR